MNSWNFLRRAYHCSASIWHLCLVDIAFLLQWSLFRTTASGVSRLPRRTGSKTSFLEFFTKRKPSAGRVFFLLFIFIRGYATKVAPPFLRMIIRATTMFFCANILLPYQTTKVCQAIQKAPRISAGLFVCVSCLSVQVLLVFLTDYSARNYKVV